MTTAALFVTWGTTEVPNYTRYYIEQLAKWFDELYVLTNEDRPIDREWFKKRNIHLRRYPNKARDFEKYYYWMMQTERKRVVKYSQLCIANDSLICYGPLDKLIGWCDSRHEEIVGINDTHFPIHSLQSYFLIMKQPMLGTLWDHFEKTGIVHPLNEIDDYELKLCGMAQSFKAMFPQGGRRGWDEMFGLPFDQGVPLVKHHCIMPRKPFLLAPWQRRIRKLADPATKAWQYLPLLADKTYKIRSMTAGDAPHVVMHERHKVVTVQKTGARR